VIFICHCESESDWAISQTVLLFGLGLSVTVSQTGLFVRLCYLSDWVYFLL
jgi:hypothetical protein